VAGKFANGFSTNFHLADNVDVEQQLLGKLPGGESLPDFPLPE
jgi:hypothetical protein